MQLQASEIVSEWKQNPRLRIGGWLSIAIIAVYGLLLLGDVSEAMIVDYQQDLARLQRIQGVQQQDDWPDRAQQARAQLVQLQAGLWRAESRGLAQASIQSWMNRQLKFEHVRHEVEPAKAVSLGGGLWKVTAELKGAIQRHELIELLKRLELNKQLLRVDQLDIKQSRNADRMSMIISAYFIVAESATTAGGVQ